jgi:hypothetical protein
VLASEAAAGWVAGEATVMGCLPGDVLVIWLGVLTPPSADEDTKNPAKAHWLEPEVRKLRLVKVQEDGDRQTAALSFVPVPYASGYPLVCTLAGRRAW